MRIKPDPHGTNEQYRAARGTDKPYDFNPTAWQALRRAREFELAAQREAEGPKTAGRPLGSKGKKKRRVKERKRIARDGSVRVCSTERKTKGGRQCQ